MLSRWFILGAFSLLIYEGWFFGKRWLPHHHPIARLIISLLMIIGATVLMQTLWYYLDGYGSLQTDGASLLTALAGLHIASSFTPSVSTDQPHTDAPSKTPIKKSTVLWSTGIVGLAIACTIMVLVQAHLHAALHPIRTPWTVLALTVCFGYALLGILSVLGRKISNHPLPSILLACLSLFAVTGLTIWLYPLGFGFDGFLHRASEQLLLTSGTLSPKPLYYIGQYTFVTWMSRWLSLIHPYPRHLARSRNHPPPSPHARHEHKSSLTSAMDPPRSPLFLPLSPFITTTPNPSPIC